MTRPRALSPSAAGPDMPEPERMALFLDLDGTLAQIEPTPGAVGPDARRNTVLARATKALDGRLAVISGRTIAEVDRILNGQVKAVAGVHGLEHRSAFGDQATPPAHPGLSDAKRAFAAFAATDPGLEIEDKGVSVTLHYRRAPQAAAAARDLAGRLAASTGLLRQDGHCVVELRTPGPTKGDAVAAFMAEAPFAGAVPVFVGDDVTDEDAFAAAVAKGGLGVLVGPVRETHASFVLDNVGDVLAWLEQTFGSSVMERVK